MYDQFRTLYTSLFVLDPGLPARHALAQELEVYEKSTRTTYRNVRCVCCIFSINYLSKTQAMITAMASIKKRPPPDQLSHPSVGTIAELAERTAKLSSLSEFKLKPEHLEPLLLSREDMLMWEYVVDVPSDTGGTRPYETGNTAKCERCSSQYVVSKSPSKDECIYHWGRAYASKVNGKLIHTTSSLRCVHQTVSFRRTRVDTPMLFNADRFNWVSEGSTCVPREPDRVFTRATRIFYVSFDLYGRRWARHTGHMCHRLRNGVYYRGHISRSGLWCRPQGRRGFRSPGSNE